MNEAMNIIEDILRGPEFSTRIVTESDGIIPDISQSSADEKEGRVMPISEPIFVIGSPRSRTTALGKSLTAHPKIGGLDKESLFLLHLSDIYRNIFKEGYAPLSGTINEVELRSCLRAFSDRIFGAVLSGSDKEYYCDHTPWYGSISTFVRYLYPDARFIHLVRDGRDVVESLGVSFNEGRLWAGRTVIERIRIWAKIILLSRRVNNNSSRYIEISSEKLLNNPSITIKQITDFLRMEFDGCMVDALKTPYAVSSITRSGLSQDGGAYIPTWPDGWTDRDREYFASVSTALGIPIN